MNERAICTVLCLVSCLAPASSWPLWLKLASAPSLPAMADALMGREETSGHDFCFVINGHFSALLSESKDYQRLFSLMRDYGSKSDAIMRDFHQKHTSNDIVEPNPYAPMEAKERELYEATKAMLKSNDLVGPLDELRKKVEEVKERLINKGQVYSEKTGSQRLYSAYPLSQFNCVSEPRVDEFTNGCIEFEVHAEHYEPKE